MIDFEINFKTPIKNWNLKNPKLRQKNLGVLAEETGVSVNYLSLFGKRYNKQLKAHFEVIFNSDDKQVIRQNWEKYLQLNIIAFSRLEAIRVALECEIWDLVKVFKITD